MPHLLRFTAGSSGRCNLRRDEENRSLHDDEVMCFLKKSLSTSEIFSRDDVP
jgi:hypothetical protein